MIFVTRGSSLDQLKVRNRWSTDNSEGPSSIIKSPNIRCFVAKSVLAKKICKYNVFSPKLCKYSVFSPEIRKYGIFVAEICKNF